MARAKNLFLLLFQTGQDPLCLTATLNSLLHEIISLLSSVAPSGQCGCKNNQVIQSVIKCLKKFLKSLTECGSLLSLDKGIFDMLGIGGLGYPIDHLLGLL